MTCIRNVCWEGGGVRCIAYAGAWKRMEELGLTGEVCRLAGSSGGAIMALTVALGYSSADIEKVLRETDMSDFKDGSYTLMGKAWDLIFHLGLYKGNAFLKWLGDLITAKGFPVDLTFRQLHELTGKNLIITGSNLNRRMVEIYSVDNSPDMEVRKAVRISMSIPIFFQPVKVDTLDGTALMVDGGLLNNYAIGIFDKHGCKCVMSETLGFKLLSDGEQEDSQIFHGFDKLDTVSKVVKSIIENLMMQIERLYIKPNYWERTVAIQTHGVSATDFNLSEDAKNLLVQWGYDSCWSYFKE